MPLYYDTIPKAISHNESCIMANAEQNDHGLYASLKQQKKAKAKSYRLCFPLQIQNKVHCF